jgi:hypothetical protein
MILNVVYPVMPPTSNRIYFRGTILTKDARRYAEDFSRFFAVTHGHEVVDIDPSCLYALHLVFHFNVLNDGWLERNKSGQRKAKGPYKKVDLSNRVKLLEDCIRDAIGVDDSHTFAATQTKCHEKDPTRHRVEIAIQRVDPLMFGVPQEYLEE